MTIILLLTKHAELKWTSKIYFFYRFSENCNKSTRIYACISAWNEMNIFELPPTLPTQVCDLVVVIIRGLFEHSMLCRVKFILQYGIIWYNFQVSSQVSQQQGFFHAILILPSVCPLNIELGMVYSSFLQCYSLLFRITLFGIYYGGGSLLTFTHTWK